MEQKRSLTKQSVIAVLAAVLFIGIDQLTKYFAVLYLKEKAPFIIIPNVFQLTYVENRGAAFGVLQGKKIFFLILTCVFLILLCYCYLRMINNRRFAPLRILSVFLFAGAVGNMIDRVWHNYVVDFFYFELIDFPVFNMADIYITVSCVVFLVLFLFYYKEEDFSDFFPARKKRRHILGRIIDMNTEYFEVNDTFDGERLDKLLAVLYPSQSRTFFQKLTKDGHVFVNDTAQKSSFRVHIDDVVRVEIPPAVPVTILPEDIPLDVLYEDDDILIVNKPKDMVVHPCPGHYTKTLVNAIMYHCKDNLSGINGEIRPGIVHRIDKDTTGSLIVCKNDSSHNIIAEQIKEHSVTRRYRGIVAGVVKESSGRIEGAIGRHPTERKKMAINEKNGKPAVTHYKVLETFRNATYMEFELETGRTHQIRVHMASIGHPLLGDTTYGSVKNPFHLQGQTLHAMTIGLIHPRTNEYLEVSAPLPQYFEALLQKLRNM